MSTPNRFVVKDDGSWGVLPNGKWAVFDAFGAACECCGGCQYAIPLFEGFDSAATIHGSIQFAQPKNVVAGKVILDVETTGDYNMQRLFAFPWEAGRSVSLAYHSEIVATSGAVAGVLGSMRWSGPGAMGYVDIIHQYWPGGYPGTGDQYMVSAQAGEPGTSVNLPTTNNITFNATIAFAADHATDPELCLCDVEIAANGVNILTGQKTMRRCGVEHTFNFDLWSPVVKFDKQTSGLGTSEWRIDYVDFGVT